MSTSEVIKFVAENRKSGLSDKTIEKKLNNEPVKGDKKQFFGRWFVYSGHSWLLDEISHNVINKKNAGSERIYNAHPIK